jgi:hypothetical protein
MVSNRSVIPRPLRKAAFIALLLWACFWLARVRVAEFGLSGFTVLVMLGIFLIMVAPLALGFNAGRPWRSRLLSIGLLGAAAFSAAELLARSQEALLSAHSRLHPGQHMTASRWWPFQHHELRHQPPIGWVGDD